MSDLISRQAAIDTLCNNCTIDKPETCSTIQKGDTWCDEVYILLNLPSAQPEVAKDTNVPSNDCISRQDAIDIIEKAIDFWDGQIGCGALMAVKNRLDVLPSAEKTGKWIYIECVDADGLGAVAWKCSECEEIYTEFSDYCPHCGARMVGEQE